MPDGVEVTGPIDERYDEILTPEALAFVAALQREFGTRRGWSCWPAASTRQDASFGRRHAGLPARDGRRSATTTPGGSRRPRPAWTTAGWRSPARPTAR